MQYVASYLHTTFTMFVFRTNPLFILWIDRHFTKSVQPKLKLYFVLIITIYYTDRAKIEIFHDTNFMQTGSDNTDS